MTKRQLETLISQFGKPYYVSVRSPLDYFNKNRSIEISWGKDKNNKIINSKILGNKPFIISWSNNKPINLITFRHNGAKTSADKRAKEYKDKLDSWIQNITNV